MTPKPSDYDAQIPKQLNYEHQTVWVHSFESVLIPCPRKDSDTSKTSDLKIYELQLSNELKHGQQTLIQHNTTPIKLKSSNLFIGIHILILKTKATSKEATPFEPLIVYTDQKYNPSKGFKSVSRVYLNIKKQ